MSKANYSALASYAVIKALTDSKQFKDSYEVLAKFIQYIIHDKNLHKFSLIDIDNALKTEFGFNNIPLSTIKTALKKLAGCKKIEDGYLYTVDINFNKDEFEERKNILMLQHQNIVKKLIDFATEKCKYEDNSEKLESEFIKYLLDDSATIDQKCYDIISKFILSIEKDELVKKEISNIREGSIIFYGLAYNINEIGSVTTDLTLFLDMEILFSIAGYNGELYKRIADDFLNQVKAANIKQKRVRLRYFNEIKRDIENYFSSAERIIERRGYLTIFTAMKNILNGCNTVSDVRVKEADFFHKLKARYGIIEDENTSYYEKSNYKYNIEGNVESLPNDEKTEEALKYISHINVLRRSEQFTEYTKSKYLFITETRRIQEISNKMTSKEYVGYAVSTSFITNILWLKAGGFSKKTYPINTDISYKARLILSGELANKISRFYNETIEKYKAGEIDDEQVAARIIFMRDRSKGPDEITNDMLEDGFNFSDEYISKFEEGIKFNAEENERKKEIIENLKALNEASDTEKKNLEEKLKSTNEDLQNYKQSIKNQMKTIKEQNKELSELREEHKQNEMKKRKSKALRDLIKRMSKKFLFLILFICIMGVIYLYLSGEIITLVSSVVSVISFVITIWQIWRNDIKKYREEIKWGNDD